MATTSLWKVEARLDKVLKYISNIEKIKNKNYTNDLYKSLHNTIEYAKADFKTEKQFYVTGINCNEKTALQDMILTKKHFGKEKGILAFHGYQSFAEGEVTAEQAHRIGIRLAEELWGDKYEVVVSTHLNTNHLHNHFVINSVSFVDGKKYRNTIENYAMMRKISDELCSEFNLSVVEEKVCGKIDYTKYYNSYIQKSDYYTTTKEDIDYAIKQAYSYKNFQTILEKMGYSITIRSNKISLCRPPYKRNIRIERSFGEEYSIANINERIMSTDNDKLSLLKTYRKPKSYTAKSNIFKTQIDRGSIYRLYLHYCYILKVFPKKEQYRVKISPELRKEIKNMNEISEEIRFLCKNKIKTIKDLSEYKALVINELKIQMKNRNSLRRKRQNEKDPVIRQKLCDDILDLTDKINYLKQEAMYCEKIESQNQKIKINMKALQNKEVEEKIKRKENLKDEHIRLS